jgi:hypothetical protein
MATSFENCAEKLHRASGGPKRLFCFDRRRLASCGVLRIAHDERPSAGDGALSHARAVSAEACRHRT